MHVQETVGTSSPPGQVPQPHQTHLHDTALTPESAPATPPPDSAPQSLGSLQSGGLQTLSSNSMPSSYPNAPQPIGPPSGSVSHSNTQSASQDQPMHKTSTSDLGGVAVDPPVRPSYNPQPQQELHSNGGPQHAQHDAWGTVSSKPSSAGSAPGQPGAASQAGLSQQGNFGQPSQHQSAQQNNLGPSLLSSLNGQNSSGPSTSDALHSLSGLSTPALSTSTAADAQGHINFQKDRSSQYSMPQVDQLQMQFGQVQLNGNDFSSGFGTGFGPPSSQSQSQSTGHNALEPDMSFLHQQPSQLQQHSQQQYSQQQQQPQPQQQLSQQASQPGSDAATSTADGLIQQHRPSGSSDYQGSAGSRGYGAFQQSHGQPPASRAIPSASQAGPTSVSAGIQTESSSLGDNAGKSANQQESCLSATCVRRVPDRPY